MNVRPYQQQCVGAIIRELATRSSTLAVMATGTGKTICFANLIPHFSRRVLVVAHRHELIQQAADKIFAVTGHVADVEMGDRWAAAGSHLLGSAKVVVSSIQTQCSGARGAGRMARFNQKDFDAIIIDEAHHAPAASYRRMIEYYRGGNPEIKIVGLTATPDRADEKAMGKVFESVAFEYPIMTAIDDGYLVPIQQQSVFVKSLDFSKVRSTAGDLNTAELEAVMEVEETMHAITTPTFEIVGKRQALVFAVSRLQAKRMTEILNRHEADCANFVDCETPAEQRKVLFADFGAKKFRFLLNVGIATEGTDIPGVEVVILARPTESRALFSQMIGRGTRPLPGIVDQFDDADTRCAAISASDKPHMLVLDFVGNAGKHDLCSVADILGGDFSDDARKRVKDKHAKGEAILGDVIEQLKTAEAQLIQEREDAEAQRARRNIKATATYTTETSDPFGVLGIAPRQAPPGLQRTHSLSAKQVAFLESNGIKAGGLTMNKASQLIGELMERRKTGKCSFKQAKLLRKYGYSADMTFAQARTTIDAIAAAGWKRPAEGIGA